MRSDPMQRSEAARVITFRPRAAKGAAKGPSVAPSPTSPVADLKQYQRVREDEDYRHRMIVNVLALGFCIALAVAGVWLVNEIAEMKRVQDCVLSGRAGCVPLPIATHRNP